MKKIKEWLPYIIIIIAVIIVRTYIITPARVDGASMEDTLHNGEVVLVNKMNVNTEKLFRFQIIVFKQDKDLLVKRIVGLPGETVQYKDNVLYVNGRIVTPETKFEYTEDFEGTADANEFFVLGDNRDDSKDSRYFGGVNIKDIKGSVVFILYPFEKFGNFEYTR